MGFTGAILPTLGVLGWLCAGAALLALVVPLRQPEQVAA